MNDAQRDALEIAIRILEEARTMEKTREEIGDIERAIPVLEALAFPKRN